MYKTCVWKSRPTDVITDTLTDIEHYLNKTRTALCFDGIEWTPFFITWNASAPSARYWSPVLYMPAHYGIIVVQKALGTRKWSKIRTVGSTVTLDMFHNSVGDESQYV